MYNHWNDEMGIKMEGRGGGGDLVLVLMLADVSSWFYLSFEHINMQTLLDSNCY